jgi:hypothetical protein
VGSNATSGLALLQDFVASWRDPGVLMGHDPANSFGTLLVYSVDPISGIAIVPIVQPDRRAGRFAGQQLKSYLAHTQGEVHRMEEVRIIIL